MILTLDRLEGAVVNIGTAVLLIVRGQHFGPLAALGERNLVILPCLAREVHDNDHLLAILADTHEAERVMVGVIAGQPLESGRIEVLAPQCGRRLVQGVQVGDELLYATVVRPIESIPIHRTVMIPFAVLRHLIAHEGELFARMAHW